MRLVYVVACLIAVFGMTWAAIAYAQDERSEAPDVERVEEVEEVGDVEGVVEGAETVKRMEEIKVIARPQGRTTLDLEEQRLERMKEAMYTELRLRQQEEEEVAWRQADPDLKNPKSRIKWGYSPQAEYRMRQDNDFVRELSNDQVQPASLIRIGF